MIAVDWGSVPEWLSALGTVLALFAAVWAIRLQSAELSEQRKELALQRKQLELTARAHQNLLTVETGRDESRHRAVVTRFRADFEPVRAQIERCLSPRHWSLDSEDSRTFGDPRNFSQRWSKAFSPSRAPYSDLLTIRRNYSGELNQLGPLVEALLATLDAPEVLNEISSLKSPASVGEIRELLTPALDSIENALDALKAYESLLLSG